MTVSKLDKHNSIKTISSSCYFSGAWENAHLWGGQTTFMSLLPQYFFFSGAASLWAPWFQCLFLFSSNKFAYRRTHLEKIAQFCYANLSNALDTNIEGREDVVRIQRRMMLGEWIVLCIVHISACHLCNKYLNLSLVNFTQRKI